MKLDSRGDDIGDRGFDLVALGRTVVTPVPYLTRSTDDGRGSKYALGDRVFHLKFGYGRIEQIEGNKLSIEFEKAGRKKVLDSFVSKG